MCIHYILTISRYISIANEWLALGVWAGRDG